MPLLNIFKNGTYRFIVKDKNNKMLADMIATKAFKLSRCFFIVILRLQRFIEKFFPI